MSTINGKVYITMTEHLVGPGLGVVLAAIHTAEHGCATFAQAERRATVACEAQALAIVTGWPVEVCLVLMRLA